MEKRDEKRYFASAMVCAVIAEVNRNRDKKSEPFTPQDFMPNFGKNKPKKEAQPWQAQLAFVEQLNKHFGGVDFRSKKQKPESQEEEPVDG